MGKGKQKGSNQRHFKRQKYQGKGPSNYQESHPNQAQNQERVAQRLSDPKVFAMVDIFLQNVDASMEQAQANAQQ
jgi:hypothetical protein